MKIQYCSDLHLEFRPNSQYLKSFPLEVSGDILILAGDIIPLQEGFHKEPFFNWLSDHYEKVFWVPGNHEFYNRNLSEYSKSYITLVHKNIYLVHNITLNHNNVRFVFTTLWSKIYPWNESIVVQNVSDFDLIEMNYKKMKASDFNTLYNESLEFLQASIDKDPLKTVVVTHHLPSPLCNSVAHNSSPIKDAFCSDLTDWIAKSGVNIWIHGHSHYNHKPIYIGNTIMLTNQLGYVHAGEHHQGFKHNAHFSI